MNLFVLYKHLLSVFFMLGVSYAPLTDPSTDCGPARAPTTHLSIERLRGSDSRSTSEEDATVGFLTMACSCPSGTAAPLLLLDDIS